jgi:hypothetical protein
LGRMVDTLPAKARREHRDHSEADEVVVALADHECGLATRHPANMVLV